MSDLDDLRQDVLDDKRHARDAEREEREREEEAEWERFKQERASLLSDDDVLPDDEDFDENYAQGAEDYFHHMRPDE